MKIGIDLGGSHIAVGIVENDKIICKKEKDFVEEDRKDIENVIKNVIIEFIEKNLKESNTELSSIEKIGIAAPGTVKNGVIIKAENLGIINFELIKMLKNYFNYEKITLNNDAKCSALCEKRYGNLQNYEDAVFICLGTGIGGAVFLNGELLKPKNYSGFEIRTYYNTEKWRKMYLWFIWVF